MPDLREIEDLIELMRRSGVSELSLELPDYKIKIKRGPDGEVRQESSLPPPQAPEVAPTAGANVTIVAEVVSVVSPVVGVFHNGGMGEPRTLIGAGDPVQEGQLLAVIEAMKVPNEVRAPISGLIAQVLVEDGAAVGYGDRLFLIQPLQEEGNEGEAPIGLA